MKNEYELYLENRHKPKKTVGFKTIVIISLIMIVAVSTVGATVYQQASSNTNSKMYTPEMAQGKLYKLFCDDRSDYGVSPAVFDSELSNRSYYRAMDVRDYGVGEDPSYLHEDIFIVNQEAFGRSYYSSPGQFVDRWRNEDRRFFLNELDRDNTRVGIGVAEGNGNFYIVVRWE